MKLPEILKNAAYAILFGFVGIIIGIWIADLLYVAVLKNIDRVTTSYISLILIILIAALASIFGFMKGRSLLES